MSLIVNTIQRPAEPRLEGLRKWGEIARFLMSPVPSVPEHPHNRVA